MSTGEKNRRVIVKAWATSGTDSKMNPVNAEVSSWPMWAEVENRSGNPVTSEGQQVWNYDCKITVRAEVSRPIKSNMTVDYEGARYSINEVVVDSEGFKKEYILRCSKTDEVIS